ncbi:hypothetical protein GDO86_006220 [Hymenochirus boettgeri]|uniref:Fork-head domain-containing protein n=1 Tax=Hymenochirus boettgeri TaxID=247094 RepID=A0A8T2JA79_9PIPI|nr:hypothetical protein GDO86_006220 [Hymenochirus boettgeri]
MPRPGRNTYSDQKPPYSYISLTAMAIQSSQERCCHSETRPAWEGSFWALHPSCGDMFENGSFLRRRKRFKVMKSDHLAPTKPSDAAQYLQQQAKLRLSALAASGTHLPQMSTYNLGVSQTSSFKHPLPLRHYCQRIQNARRTCLFTMQPMTAAYPLLTS